MEDSSLFPLKCGFCGHGNPANSRYCNACGAPLTAQPCPQCGTTNDAMATTCQECDAPLADHGPNEFFLPLPPEVPAPARAAPHLADVAANTAAARPTAATVESAAPNEVPAAGHRPSRVATPPPREAAAATSVPHPSESATAAGSDQVPTSADEVPPAPTAPAVVAAVPVHDGAAGTPRGRGLAWAAVLVAVGIAVYFAYGYFQRFQPSDAAPRPGASGVATDRMPPALAEKSTAAPTAVAPSDPAKPVAGGAAPPATGAPEHGTAAVGQTKVTAGDGTGGKGGHGTAPAGAGSAQPQPPTDIFVVKPDSDPRRTAPQVQETTKAAAAGTQGEVKRAASGGDRGAVPRAPAAGACTEAIAALGLCTPENTQGRKP